MTTSIQNPITIIELTDKSTSFPRPSYTIPPPHNLYTPTTLPKQFHPHHPIYLILPSQPYTTLSPSTTRHLLTLTTQLPPQNLFLLFPKNLQPQHILPYETLFRAPSLTSHPAANLLSTLPSSTTITTTLSITLPSKTNLQNLLLLHPSTPNTPKLSNTATLVALGASPPPTHTLTAIPGYKLTHIPATNTTTTQFLSHLHSKNYTFLLRFPDNNHLFLYKSLHIWHGLLLPIFQISSIQYLNPTAITKHLNHPPRIPIYRPLLRLPIYHKPPNTPPNFRSAVYTVAHRQHSNLHHPPTSHHITALDTKILSHRIKHTSPTTSQLKRARFNRLHTRSSKRIKRSVTTPKQKRLKTRYFSTALSTILSTLTTQPKFFTHPYPNLSWENPDKQVAIKDNHFQNIGIHGIEFCDEARDSCIRSCESLIGKSVAEFAYANIGKTATRKIRTAIAKLRRQTPKELINSPDKDTEETLIHAIDLPQGKTMETIINNINPLTLLPSQVEE